MELIERNCSIISGKAGLEPLAVFSSFPVFCGCVDTGPEKDLFADMTWCIDRETGVIQLSKLIPLEVLYQAQHVDGCGATWESYSAGFASFISEQRPRSVLEIGGGQGRLKGLIAQGTDPRIAAQPGPGHEPRAERAIAGKKTFIQQMRQDITDIGLVVAMENDAIIVIIIKAIIKSCFQ